MLSSDISTRLHHVVRCAAVGLGPPDGTRRDVIHSVREITCVCGRRRCVNRERVARHKPPSASEPMHEHGAKVALFQQFLRFCPEESSDSPYCILPTDTNRRIGLMNGEGWASVHCEGVRSYGETSPHTMKPKEYKKLLPLRGVPQWESITQGFALG